MGRDFVKESLQHVEGLGFVLLQDQNTRWMNLVINLRRFIELAYLSI